MNSQRKITILGAGHVGSHCAMALAAGAVCEEIVLVDALPEKAAAQALDVADALSFPPRPVTVRAGSLADCADADILVVAIGRAKFVTADMVKPGAVVIDVGMNRNEAGKLCGDVDFENVEKVAGWITPVPGGVGPMTITMLLQNTIKAAQLSKEND